MVACALGADGGFSAQVAQAIGGTSVNGRAFAPERGHIGRYVTALDMIRSVARPDMKVVDLASFGTMLPALRWILGLEDVTVTGLPIEGRPAHGEMVAIADTRRTQCPFDLFDIEGPFPYADGAFDLVIFTEVLEHITRDPMHAMAEINRITKPRGWLLLSTPNCISLRSVINAVRGSHPYIWSQYSPVGNRDRHNREYTPFEVRELAHCAGYRVAQLITSDDVYGAQRSPAKRRAQKWLANMVLAGITAATGRYVAPMMRGESTFVLAQKTGHVATRLPSFLYYD